MSKITKEKPEIICIIYRQEPDDPNYGSCLWAIFDLDPGRGMLSIQSDCGNYAYRWPERGEDFLKLFRNMSEDYLLGKLCGKPAEFDEEATISRIEEYLTDMELDDRRKEHALNSLKGTFQNYTLDDVPELAQFLVDQWNDDNVLEIDCAWELVRTRYGVHQKRIVSIFREFIAPELFEITEGKDGK